MQLPEHLIGGIHRAHVFLDGVEVHGVTEAHTGEGWLVRICRDAHGKRIISGNEIATERLIGVVTAAPM